MEPVDAVEAVAGRGLRGDRYFDGSGYYAPSDTCQVTLIASEAIADIDAEVGIDLSAGEHRRNVVTEGVDVHDLLDHRFRVGDPMTDVEPLDRTDEIVERLRATGETRR